MEKNNSNNTFKNTIDKDEIDLRLIFQFLKRNVRRFIIYGSSTFIIFCLFSLTLKRTYRGEFQIVISKQSEDNPFLSQLGSITSSLNIRGFSSIGSSTNLSTQIEILQSPLLLMPVYEFYNEEMKSKNDKFLKESFRDWEKKIKLENIITTSVLNISFDDNDKDIIIPVLKKISNGYQGLEEKKRQNLMKNTSDYFQKQIDVYNKKSTDSYKKAQLFAINNSLPIINDIKLIEKDNIESMRITAVNKINFIDEQLNQISKIENNQDLENFLFLSSANNDAINNQINNLAKINSKLSFLRNTYKNDDILIRMTLEEKDILLTNLKSLFISYLKSEKSFSQATLKTASRSAETLIKYQELMKNSLKDSKILAKLEDSYRMNQLEQQRIQEPWEVITKPNLLDYPVAPSRKRIGIIGLLFGFLMAGARSYLLEKKSDFIFSIKEVCEIFKKPILFKIDLSDEEDISNKLAILKIISEENLEKKAIYLIDDKEINFSVKIKNYFIEENIENLKFIQDFSLVKSFSSLILFVKIGSSKRKDLINLNQKFRFLNLKTIDIVILNN